MIVMLPALMAGIGAVYSVGRLHDGYRYWSDYYKNTGYMPKYLIRTTTRDVAPIFMLRSCMKSVRRR